MAVVYEAGRVLLDKPPANSYEIEFMRELGAAVEAASADSDTRVVVVESASEKFFCAGADIKTFLANDADTNMEMIRVAHAALSSMAASPKLLVAWISGHASARPSGSRARSSQGRRGASRRCGSRPS